MKSNTVEKILDIVSKKAPTLRTLTQADSMRKMVFLLSDDMNDVLSCLEQQLFIMRGLDSVSVEEQKRIAHETIMVWAPIASRLGVSAVKDELEDLSLKYSNPDVYEHIKQIVSLKKEERFEYLEKAKKAIYKAAEKSGFSVTVKSRAKHFWSIYQKMKKRNKSADELYDLMALRILCDSVDECYRIIGLVHSLWKPITKKFKDYIASPKSNGYQSLHTAVMYEDVPLEIQIRTFSMHEVAEHGMASHWQYKQRSASADETAITGKMVFFEKTSDSKQFIEDVKKDLLSDKILVFTPEQDIIQLARGSTALDFAYSIHSTIGEKTVGAKADGHIIQLSTPLKSTQTIEILTSASAHPTRGQLEFAKTARARSKIRHWLVINDESFKDSKSELSLITAFPGQEEKLEEKRLAVEELRKKRQETRKKENEEAHLFSIEIEGSANYIISAAKCCAPVRGDKIVGYISRGRGIIIHKENCPNLTHIEGIEKRTVNVVWDKKED